MTLLMDSTRVWGRAATEFGGGGRRWGKSESDESICREGTAIDWGNKGIVIIFEGTWAFAGAGAIRCRGV